MQRLGSRILLLLISILIALLVGLFMLSEAGYSRLSALNVRISDVQERQKMLAQLVRLVTEAETSQRGLLLTQDAKFLAPYDSARQRTYRTLAALEESHRLMGGAPEPGAEATLRNLIDRRYAQMERSQALYREEGAANAIAAVRAGDDFDTMNQLRALVRLLEAHASDALVDALAIWLADLRTMRLAMAGATLLNVLLVIVAGALVVRNLRRRASENSRLQREVRDRTRELAALSSHLQELSEREKKALARDLHDALGGMLVATKMDVAWIRNRLKSTDPAIEQRWERIQQSLDQGVDFKRRIVEQLRPTLLDNMGLFAALRWQLRETCSRANLECRERLPDEELPLTSEASIALFRIAQEALTNVLKHARATMVQLQVDIDANGLSMMIADNGRGMPSPEDATALGHGLAGMRHRLTALGGRWQIRRRDGGGTEIRVDVPLPAILAAATDDSIASPAVPPPLAVNDA